MTMDGLTFERWLEQAEVSESRLSPPQREVLRAAFHFLVECGGDYYSQRILAHFLLHGGIGLKVAQIARLVQVSRQSASRYRQRSSKQVVQEAHHRLTGRPYGKLLPRYAGPILEFLLSHPQASRHDVLDFIERTWKVGVSTVALHHFLKRYGLDRATRAQARAGASGPTADPPPSTAPLVVAEPGAFTPLPPQDLFLPTPPTRGRSSCGPRPSAGWRSPRTASPTNTAPCHADC